MRYGERLKLKADRFDEKGRGCGPVSDGTKIGCSRYVIPGETAEASFIGREKGRLKMAEPAILEPSPDRVKPECPHFGTCGGCALQHVRYERQLEAKKEQVTRAFSTAGLSLVPERIVASDAVFHHRNRMDYVFGPGGALGLKEAGRWDRFVDLSTCLLLSEDAVEVMRRTKAWAAESGNAPWDNRKQTGFLKYLLIREGKNTGERMALLLTAEGEILKERELVAALDPLCTSIVHGINPKITDISVAETVRALKGETFLRERAGGADFEVPGTSFFQTNTAMAEKLLAHVRGLVLGGPHARLLDLYCGSGFFSVAMAKDVEEALGVELDAAAIAAASRNAELNGASNIRYRAEAAEALSWETEKPEVVILDPPRSGLHPTVKRTLLKNLPPRLIYVSCNPRALALDLVELLTAYDPGPAVAFDLFPQTMHVETVIELRKR